MKRGISADEEVGRSPTREHKLSVWDSFPILLLLPKEDMEIVVGRGGVVLAFVAVFVALEDTVEHREGDS